MKSRKSTTGQSSCKSQCDNMKYTLCFLKAWRDDLKKNLSPPFLAFVNLAKNIFRDQPTSMICRYRQSGYCEKHFRKNDI